MTKTKARPRRQIDFPPHVLEVKEYLRKNDTECFSVMKKLTEAKDLEKLEDLKRMWRSLETAIKKQPPRLGSPKEQWVYFFVSYASGYSDMPRYYYQTKSQRKKLVEGLKKLTGQLARKLKDNKLDHHLAYSDSRNILYFYEKLDFLDFHRARKSPLEKPTITEMLTRLVEALEREVPSLRQSRTDSYEKARPFVYNMGKYLKSVHGSYLTTALATATNALFNRNYSAADIQHILKR